MVRLGIIADDFTGASDAASFLANEGVSVLLYSGIPSTIDTDCPVVVIALKTRTLEAFNAVAETMNALNALRSAGAEKIYLKYCSTFDSTTRGNIGPTVDAVMEILDVPFTILDPALPINGRTLREGVLYVNGVPLAESPMKDHPLTPMWASSIEELMALQGRHQVINVPLSILKEPVATTHLRAEIVRTNQKAYLVPDHWEDEHAEIILEAFGDLPFLTGGSALAGAWGRRYRSNLAMPSSATSGKCLLLAGSCSEATRKQIKSWQDAGLPSYQINPQDLVCSFENEINRITDLMKALDCLVYSSDTPGEVARLQNKYPHVDRYVEKALGMLSARALSLGANRFIVAGGETSGVVAQTLGYSAFRIGESITPGVPVLHPIDDADKRLVLKSGNFGEEDFFIKAWKRTENY